MNKLLLKGLKNIPGWRCRDKLVVFSVDDYGNVRLDSPSARERMQAAGVAMDNHFDCFDALETRQDLDALFTTLDSVRDSRGHPAKFTAYALSANPDFRRMREDGENYHYESLTSTFERLAASQPDAYQGAWALWHEGIQKGLIQPQFHGREHLNVRLIEHKLRSRDKTLRLALENDSLTALASEPGLPGVGFTAAFAISDGSELEAHKAILADGLKLFEQVFGFHSTTFTPPAMQLHPALYPMVENLGIRAIDKPQRYVRRLDAQQTRREFNSLGPARGHKHINLVRNVVFEPCKDMGVDPVEHALGLIGEAFRWRKPAIISSHRVNFCGHIDPANRKRGLDALGKLLQGIVTRWPDVQFVSADELAQSLFSSSTVGDVAPTYKSE